MSKAVRTKVRMLQTVDREAVRQICCDTGFLGKPVDPVFEDRELFADFLCNYYTDGEPESSMVLEDEGEVVGYILGSRFPGRKSAWEKVAFMKLAPKVAGRFIRRYKAPTRNYLLWLLFNGRKETPEVPGVMPHIHINLLPPYRDVRHTKQFIGAYLDFLRGKGEKQVYGQMVTYENRRGTRVFEKMGFKVTDCKEVTKFRKYVSETIHLFTIVMDLEAPNRFFGRDA